MKKKNVGKALVLPLLAAAAFASIGVGTTFALFTSKAEAEVNVTAGKVKVTPTLKVVSASSLKEDIAVAEDGSATFANGGTVSLKDGIITLNNITPGDKVTLSLSATNESNVAIKHRVSVKRTGELAFGLKTSLTGGASSTEFIESPDGAYYTRWADAGVSAGADGKQVGDALPSYSITIELPEEAGNEWQEKSAKVAITYEAYQGNASVEEATAKETDATYLYTPDDLMAFAKDVNSGNNYSGKTVYLESDLDMTGYDYVPIAKNIDSYPGTAFQGIFDGGNHTISNIKSVNREDTYSATGLFGAISGATVRNVTVKNADFLGCHWAGGIVGYISDGTTATFENCHVLDSKIASAALNNDDGDKVGGFAGYFASVTKISNSSVKNVTVQGYRDMGGFIGCLGAAPDEMSNNSVDGVSFINDLREDYKNYATAAEYNIDGMIGRNDAKYAPDATNTTANVGEVKYIVDDSAVFDKVVNLTVKQQAVVDNFNQESVEIDLDGDIEVQNNLSYMKWGGSSTTSMVINGNGHSIYLNTSYWTRVGMNNENSTLTIRDAKMGTNVSSLTYLEGHYIWFWCNVDLENVDFSSGIGLDPNEFMTGALTASLSHVTIHETKDLYALWIGGDVNATLDDVTINSLGRAIKASDYEQPSPHAGKVINLTVSNSKFASAKYAAVMASNTGGVNVTVSNVDISNVKGDSTNFVWVDQGYDTSKVTVTGCTKTARP